MSKKKMSLGEIKVSSFILNLELSGLIGGQTEGATCPQRTLEPDCTAETETKTNPDTTVITNEFCARTFDVC